jgi:hypothetical protein
MRRVYSSVGARVYLASNARRDLLARFVKADDSVRMTRFQFLGERRRSSDGCVTVYDPDRSDWRTLNLDTVDFIRRAAERPMRLALAA